MGDKILDTLVAMLRSKGLTANNYGIAIEISSVPQNKLQSCLRTMLKEGVPDAYELARSVANKAMEKYDNFLTDELLSADYAASKFDAEGAFKVLTSIM